MKIIAVWIAFFLVSAPAFADGPALGWPVACTEGKDCWIVNYVDQNPSPEAQDFHCGHMTYEGHDGTDIAVRDFAAMRNGMNVLAALDGKVVRVRNDVDDHHGTAADLAAAKQSKKDCGNLVSLLHADNWVTEYCHMKKGSVAVTLGETLKKGMKLGEVGQSGRAKFPHLHFSLKDNNTAVDPFTGSGVGGCGTAGHELWDTKIPYNEVKIFAGEFWGEVPDTSTTNLSVSPAHRITPNAPSLIFWVSLYGLEAGDKLEMMIYAPNGKIFAKSQHVAPQRKIRYSHYTGKRNVTRLIPGVYEGIATLTRTLPNGQLVTRKVEKSITIR